MKINQSKALAMAITVGMLSASGGAYAQDEGAEETEEAADGEGAEDTTDLDAPAGNASSETSVSSDDMDLTLDTNNPTEKKGEQYMFIGARYRGIILPKFMLNLFADGGTTVYIHGVGPEFIVRKDGFEYNLSVWFAFYDMEETPFKGSNEEESAWEIVQSELTLLYLTSDFMWSNDVSPTMALNYGAGFGLGLVFGDLYRTQAYQPAGTNSYEKCTGPTDPSGFYCNNNNDHYNGYTEPSWANSGSKPFIFPWLALQMGARYKPHKNFVARLDLGFGTSGFFFGIGADYGL